MQVSGQIGGEGGQVRVGPGGQGLAHPQRELALVQHAPHERGLEDAGDAVPVGVRGPQVAAAGCGPVSLSRHGLHLRPGQLSPRIRTSTSGEAHTPRVSFDPLAPYGPVIESTVRVVTWNVWGRFGADWAGRQAGLESAAAAAAAPDLVCLTESWRQAGVTQASLVAGLLGWIITASPGTGSRTGGCRVFGLVSRWPMSEPERRPLRALDGAGAGVAVHVSVAGERGPIQLFAVMLDYPLGASGIRQGQVRQLAEFVAETAPRRDLVVVCGDFNAGPDSDEIRLLTGRSASVVPGMVFYDAWEVAGDGSPGFTWSNRNPLAALGLFPTGGSTTSCPRGRGAGEPGTRCVLAARRAAGRGAADLRPLRGGGRPPLLSAAGRALRARFVSQLGTGGRGWPGYAPRIGSVPAPEGFMSAGTGQAGGSPSARAPAGRARPRRRMRPRRARRGPGITGWSGSPTACPGSARSTTS